MSGEWEWVLLEPDDLLWHAAKRSEIASQLDEFTTACGRIRWTFYDDEVEGERDGVRCPDCLRALGRL